MPIDLPHLTDKIHRDADQAIQRLREAIEDLQLRQAVLLDRVGSLPVPLTLDQIRDALAPTGIAPLPTAGLLNTEPPPTSPVEPLPPPAGQQTFTAWGAICRDGLQVSCVASQTSQTPTLQFGSDTPIVLPEYGSFLSAVFTGSAHLAIVKGVDSGQAILVNRTGAITMLGVAYGNYSVALRNDGTPVWQEDANNYSVGGVSTPIPAPYVGTTNGFLQLDILGDPVWTDEQLATPIVIDGVTFLLATTDGTWTVGTSEVTPQFIAYDSATTTMYVIGVTYDSPIALRLAQQADGSATVAASLPTQWINSTAGFSTYAVPPAIPDDDIDITTVIFVQGAPTPDPTAWPKTTELSAVAQLAGIVTTNYQFATWPGVGPSGAYQGQQWIFAFIGGQWYAGAASLLTYPGDQDGDYSMASVGAFYFAGTFLETWTPAPADSIGFMVTPPARLGQWGAAERSNIVLITW